MLNILFRCGYSLAFGLLALQAGMTVFILYSSEWNPVSSPLLVWTTIPMMIFSLALLLLVWLPADADPIEWLMPVLFPFVAFMICRLLFMFYQGAILAQPMQTIDEGETMSWFDMEESTSEPPKVMIPQFSADPGQTKPRLELPILPPPPLEQPEVTLPDPPQYPVTFYFSTISLILMGGYSLAELLRYRWKLTGQTYRVLYCAVALASLGVAIHSVLLPYGPLLQIIDFE